MAKHFFFHGKKTFLDSDVLNFLRQAGNRSEFIFLGYEVYNGYFRGCYVQCPSCHNFRHGLYFQVNFHLFARSVTKLITNRN